jgi:arsenate reductase
MAEGIARHLLGKKHQIFSAGSDPSHLNPLAIKVLKEINIDISHHRSKSVKEIDLNSIDLVITLCTEEICPIVPGKVQRLHWPFYDPAGKGKSNEEQVEAFREIRDLIFHKIEKLG